MLNWLLGVKLWCYRKIRWPVAFLKKQFVIDYINLVWRELLLCYKCRVCCICGWWSYC